MINIKSYTYKINSLVNNIKTKSKFGHVYQTIESVLINKRLHRLKTLIFTIASELEENGSQFSTMTAIKIPKSCSI